MEWSDLYLELYTLISLLWLVLGTVFFSNTVGTLLLYSIVIGSWYLFSIVFSVGLIWRGAGGKDK